MNLQLKVPVVYRQSARDTLTAHCDLPAQQLLSCFRHGAIWLEHKGKPKQLRDPQHKVGPGMSLYLYCNEFTLQECPYHPRLIQDFNRFSVWNKPAGMLSQGSKWGDHWTLARWIELNHWPERRCFITHRLDRFTRGLMIVAHDAKTNQDLHRAFAERKVSKTYRAVVSGTMLQGEQQVIQQAIEERPATTRIEVLEADTERQLSLVEAYPETGRKHQLRIHLAGIGHPVLGDRQYGDGSQQHDLQLQSCALVFDHPHDGIPIELTLPDTELLSLPL